MGSDSRTSLGIALIWDDSQTGRDTHKISEMEKKNQNSCGISPEKGGPLGEHKMLSRLLPGKRTTSSRVVGTDSESNPALSIMIARRK